jgi:hypothetical protein
MIRCTIVCGGDPTTREAAIATRLDPHHGAAVIIEGARAATPQLPLPGTPALSSLINIVPDCPCCGTALILRVTLDRVLRQRAPVLFLSLDASTHASHVATPQHSTNPAVNGVGGYSCSQHRAGTILELPVPVSRCATECGVTTYPRSKHEPDLQQRPIQRGRIRH